MGSPTFSRRRKSNGDKTGIFILLAVLVLAFFAIHSANPPAPVSRSADDTVFSAERAKDYINIIAKSPHGIGTPENDSVRKYIHAVCDQLGLQTSIQTTTSLRNFRNTVVAGKVNNIIARIKGTNNSKAVLIMGHYDSQPNTPGAGDDAASTGAMLETARALKAGPPLENDVIFLFTDGEEMGLLGAQAFVNDTSLLHEVGLVMNFDGRGNAGVSNTFEVNPENGWVITEFAKAAPYPIANSFSYEVYKRLPNYTDYTAFKEKDVTGLNSGFIEGFVNYHSMTDIPASLDLGSVQQYGANMLSLGKHFGSLDLLQTKGRDICYFNFIGNWLIRYPASWNLFFVWLTTILFIAFLVIGFRRRRINLTTFLINTFLFTGVLVLTMCAAFLVEKLIKSWYPLYDRFYDSNSYNSYYYFFTITTVSICVFALVYQWAVRKFSADALLAGALMVLVILMHLTNMTMSTASYLFFLPILILIIGNIIIFVNGIGENENQLGAGLAYLFFLAPAIFLFVPVVYFSFVAFGLGQIFIPIMMLTILLGLLIPILYPVLKKHRYLVTNFCLALAVIGFVMGHLTSGYNEKKPLQVNLWYRLDADSMKASWVSDFTTKDYWNKQFFPRSRQMKINQSMEPGMIRLTNDAVVLPLSAPVLAIQKDTVEGAVRKLSLHAYSTRNAISLNILISRNTNLKAISIDGKNIQPTIFHGDTSNYFKIAYYGLTKEGANINLEIPSNTKANIILIDRSMGLNAVKGFTGYPKDIIPGSGRTSNTIQVVKHFSF